MSLRPQVLVRFQAVRSLAEGDGLDTAPLTPDRSRLEEVATRVGDTERP